MNECEKYWFRVNKRHLIADCCGAAVFTALGGGRLIAVIFYVMAVELCGMNYLGVLHFSGNDNASLNLVKTLTAPRRMFFDTYVKMMLLQTAVFAAVFALGTWIGSVSGIDLPLVPQMIFKNGTDISNLGYYTLLIAIIIIVLVVMTRFTEKCTTVGRAMLLIGTIYIAMIYQPFYLLLLTLSKLSPQIELIHNIFAAASFVVLCVMAAIFAVQVKMMRAKFVLN